MAFGGTIHGSFDNFLCMNTSLNRALAAPIGFLVGFLACQTALVVAEVGAAEVLPSTLSQIRAHQLARINDLKVAIFRTPHDYYAVGGDVPILSTNVAVSGLSPEAVTNRLREAVLALATLATNFPPTDSSVQRVEFHVMATAREANIQTIFPDDGAPTGTSEMMGVNCYFSIFSDGEGGYVLPESAVAETIPVYTTPYVFLPFPDLKYFDGPAPHWFIRFKYVRESAARVFAGNPDASVSEIPGKRWGSSYIDYTQTPGPTYGEYAYTYGAKVLVCYNMGRIGIHLSLITNGTPAVLVLEAADGTFPRYLLTTGQPIVSPVVTGLSLINGRPKVNLVGQPGDLVVLESAGGFGPRVQWTTEVALPALSASGIANYLCPTAVNSPGASNRFWRIRVVQQATQSRP